MSHGRAAARRTPGDPGAPDPAVGGDAGFSVVEVVVAMSVFAVTTVAVLAVLVSALGGARSNAQRVQAANIAAQQVEAVRSLRADQIPDGVTTPATSGTTVDGTTYTVAQSAAFLSGDGAASICTSTSARPTFKRVSVTVTWPDMGGVAPVRSDTVVSVGLGRAGLDETRGIAAVLVQDADATPVAGQLVTLGSGSSQLTGADGCAVFANLAPGSYTAGANTPGYVGIDGTQALARPVTVVAAEVRRVQLDYDRAGSLTATWVPPTGHALPTGTALPLTLSFAQYSAGPKAFTGCFTGAASCAVPGLFPGSYSAWAGTCADAKPSGAAPGAAVTRLGTGSVNLPLAGAAVTVTARTGTTAAGRTLYARHAADAGCATTDVTLGTVPATGALRVALPQGRWTFSLSPGGTGTAATLSAGSSTAVGLSS